MVKEPLMRKEILIKQAERYCPMRKQSDSPSARRPVIFLADWSIVHLL